MVSKDTLPTSAETFEGLCGECCCKAGAEAIDAHVRAVVREMLAEKDAEIARLRSGLDTLGKTVGERAEVVGRLLVSSLTAPEQPRKVTDAQREAIAKLIQDTATREQPGSGAWGLAITHKIIGILESTDEPAAK
jgi:hypothetical protein